MESLFKSFVSTIIKKRALEKRSRILMIRERRRLTNRFSSISYLLFRTCIVTEATINMKVRRKQTVSRVVDEQNGLVNSVCDEYAPDV